MRTSDISVLSAGAIEPGLVAAAQAFQRDTGRSVHIAWATTPMIRQKIDAGESADILVIPPAAMEDFAQTEKVASAQRVYLGQVGIGVVVREGAPIPDITTVDAFRRSILDAESVVFNRASTGLYMEGLFRDLGIFDDIEAKSVRYPNGPLQFEHLISGKGREIGIGAIVEILMYTHRGLKLVGPLPSQIQHYTAYFAVPMMRAPNAESARAFLHYLKKSVAQGLFAAHGIS
jgi:molybdate transport system substrate-binding protein